MSIIALPAPLREALQKELQAGESLLWSACPRPGAATRKSWLIWFFAVPWTGFSLVFMLMPIGMLLGLAPDSTEAPGIGMAIFFVLFAVPFVLVGLFMLSYPLRIYREAAQTVYGITTLRAIKVVLGKTKSISSLPARRFGQMRRTEYPDGSGNMEIECGNYRDSEGDRMTHRFEMYGIPDVAGAMRVLERIQADAASSA